MDYQLILKNLKKDYFRYVLSWIDKKNLLCSKSRFSVQWDADGDRVFFRDEKDQKIPAYFISALLAKIIQKKYPRAKIAHDNRLIWAIEETVKNTYLCPAGWSNFLNFMHRHKILFGAEASGHYYFRKNNLILNDGLIPILLIAEQNKPLSELIKPYQEKYFISGEINLRQKIDLKKLEKQYKDAKISHFDGLSISYKNWRFNLRQSQTENLWRLNIEARSKEILEQKQKEVYNLLDIAYLSKY